jgi:hypothetical protein
MLNALTQHCARFFPMFVVHAQNCVGPSAQLFCYAGHFDCLRFLIERGAPHSDWTLRHVIIAEQLDILNMLLARGAPATPLSYTSYHPYIGDRGTFTEGQLLCLQHVIDSTRPIHPATLTWGARGGDLQAVRFLHSRGVQLWEYACKEEDFDDIRFNRLGSTATCWKCYVLHRNVLVVPPMPDKCVLQAMQYGWVRGAPMTPAMETLFRAKRAATRAILNCFHVATSLSNREETSPQLRTTFAVMGKTPMHLIERLLMEADLEIRDTLCCSPPASNSRQSLWDIPDSSPRVNPPNVWTQKDDNFLRRTCRRMRYLRRALW